MSGSRLVPVRVSRTLQPRGCHLHPFTFTWTLLATSRTSEPVQGSRETRQGRTDTDVPLVRQGGPGALPDFSFTHNFRSVPGRCSSSPAWSVSMSVLGARRVGVNGSRSRSSGGAGSWVRGGGEREVEKERLKEETGS